MKILLFLFSTFIFFSSCSKEYSAESILGSWEVIKLRADEDEKFISSKGEVIIKFNEEELSFATKNNSCGAFYIASDDGDFSLENFFCTLVGGDFDTDILLHSLLYQTTNFEIKGRVLKFIGDGEIILIRR